VQSIIEERGKGEESIGGCRWIYAIRFSAVSGVFCGISVVNEKKYALMPSTKVILD
jgi:hypothetical protein